MAIPSGPPSYPPPWEPPWQPVGRPAALKWFIAYSVFMAVVYALCIGGGAVIILRPDLWSDTVQPEDLEAARVGGISLVLISVPLMVAFAAAPLLPRKKWAWVYHIVLIAVGLTSVCCMPATVPLLIYYLRPDVRAWFDAPV